MTETKKREYFRKDNQLGPILLRGSLRRKERRIYWIWQLEGHW